MKWYTYDFKRGGWSYSIVARNRAEADEQLFKDLEELMHCAVIDYIVANRYKRGSDYVVVRVRPWPPRRQGGK